LTEEQERRKKLNRRIFALWGVLIFVFVFLSARLFYLQVVQAEEFQAQAEQNKTRLLSLEARRGDILSRDGEVLAKSLPVFSITVDNSGEELEASLEHLAELIGDPELDPRALAEKVSANSRAYEPVEILRLPWNAESMKIISRIEENRLELPGVNVEEKPLRYYPQGGLAGHFLGYVGEISPEELQENSDQHYVMGDNIGKNGIERIYEESLRGQKGTRQVEVNVNNQLVRELVTIPPTPGDSLVLTVDYQVQKTLEESLDRVIAETKERNPKAGAGAGVVIDVNSGAILAMASRPGINPNDYITGEYNQKLDYYQDPKLSPALNRATMAAYPPGSTFKPITGMAAVASGSVKPTDTIVCTGAYWKPPYIKCTAAHGTVDLTRALAVSCNTYFQWAGEQAGIEEIFRVGREFGLGQKTGSPDILSEASGNLPNPQWKKELGAILVDRNYDQKRQELEAKYDDLLAQASTAAEKEALSQELAGEKAALEAQYKIDYNFETTWHPFDTYNTAIGQGSSNYTVLQMANYIATLANGGARYLPYLVDRVVDPDGNVVKQTEPAVLNRVSVPEDAMAAVVRGMKAVASPGGTAYSRFRDFPAGLSVAAKTGTAQTGRSGDDRHNDFFGFFVSFAPAEKPQIAVAIVVEYADSGGGSGGKVTRDVYSTYFGLDLPPQ